jgi:outer membrane protein
MPAYRAKRARCSFFATRLPHDIFGIAVTYEWQNLCTMSRHWRKVMKFKAPVLAGQILALAIPFVLQAETKLAIINMNGVLAATRDGHAAVSELNARRAARSREFEQKQSEILTLQDQYNKGANTLNESARNALNATIAAKTKTVRREMEDAQTELQGDEQKILQQLGEKILAVVQRYAHDKGYTMVVDIGANTSPVLYASADIDITKEVIELYDNSSAAQTRPSSKPTTK